jgi:hypothetical protein
MKSETNRTRRTLAIDASAHPSATTPAISRIVRTEIAISTAERPLSIVRSRSLIREGREEDGDLMPDSLDWPCVSGHHQL